MQTVDGLDLWAVMPSILWFTLSLVALLVFRGEFKALLANVVWRIRAGAPIKLASFELGESYVSVNEDFKRQGGAIEVRLDENEARYRERRGYYEPNRGIFLVHRLAPSQKLSQLYDILIYLVPHRDATLACVQKVDYYFGRHWNKRIFTSIDRATGFSVATSAHGPFVCTAELYFTDGSTAMVWRYIDFEMGVVGRP